MSWAHLIDWFGDDGGMRAGVLYTDSDYNCGSLQQDNSGLLLKPVLMPHQLAGIGLTLEYFQVRDASYTNMVYIDRAEDYNLGWKVDLQAGHYGESLGSNVSAPFYGLSASWGTDSQSPGLSRAYPVSAATRA
ncbi:MAG TPA: hypothetical protein VNI53_06635 [Gammaproteobacteria bacterium]|nr:hypothetical protein [Gammaproteobacteria bacterium]